MCYRAPSGETLNAAVGSRLPRAWLQSNTGPIFALALPLPSREARVYDCFVGPASPVTGEVSGDEVRSCMHPGSTAPTMVRGNG